MLPIIGGIGALLFVVAVVIFTAIAYRRVVPTNMVHIVQYASKQIAYGKDEAGGNVYYAWPLWIPKFGVNVSSFPVSIFDINLEQYEAYDKGRLPFAVYVKAFFRISDPLAASQRVANFSQLQEQLQGVLQGAVRRILATNELEHIMQDRSSLGAQFTEEVDHQLQEWGVRSVKSIEFMDIHDSANSSVIKNIMAKEQSRIEKESRMAVAVNRQAAQTAEVIAQRDIELSQQDAKEQVGLRTATQAKNVGIADQRSQQEIQAEAKNTETAKMDVLQVSEVRKADIKRQIKVVDADAEKTATITRAEAEKAQKIQIADGDLATTLKRAEGITAEGQAKATAEAAFLMAPVTAQTTLAKEIGENAGYQQYLITIRQVEAQQAVGVEYAKNLSNADIKIIANSGDVSTGIASVGNIFSAKGGTQIGAMVSAMAQNPDVSAVAKAISDMNLGGGKK